MIPVETRSAKAHRYLRYAELTFKTTVMGASFYLAYLIITYGV
jgi:hypothetical protein